MTTLDRLGDRVGALRAYETFATRLARDLDLSPGPETQALAARLHASGPAVSPPNESTLPSVAVLPFAIQDEIARAVAEALRVKLFDGPRQEQAPSITHDLDAHALYLKGLFHRRKRTPNDLKKACTYFEQAVARDPGYARAHAALAFTYTLSGWFMYDVFAPHRAYPPAREAARRALDLDPRLAEAHLATAYLRHAYEWDGPGAEKAFKEALALDPDNLDVLGNYSGYLVSRGRQDEAIALTERGRWLDPFWIMPRVGVGIWLVAARRFDEAIDRLRQAHEMEPRLFVAPLFLGDVYRLTGCLDEARAAYTHVHDLIGDRPLILGRLGALCAAEGRPDAARNMVTRLHTLAERRHVLPSIVAEIYLALEAFDQALSWLEKACEARDTTLTLLRSWPSYDPLRSHRRFRHLLKTVGLDK